MAKRRGNQDGTFYKRANGTWCGQIMIDNKRYTVYAKGIQECREKLREKIKEKSPSSSNEKLHIYAGRLIKEKEKTLKPMSIQIYSLYNQYIKTYLPLVSISDVTERDVNSMVALMIQDGFSTSTIKSAAMFIISVTKQAVEEGLREKELKLKSISLREIKNKETKVIPVKEALKAINNYAHYKGKILLKLIVCTGMRRGEVMGLRWEDVDMENCKIYIRHNRMWTRKGYIEGIPKNNHVGEFVQFPKFFQKEFKEYKNKTQSNTCDYVFHYQDRPVSTHFVHYHAHRILKQLNINSSSAHFFRHLHATLLMNNKVDLKTIQSQLRHSSISTTDRYIHELKSQQREEISKLQF